MKFRTRKQLPRSNIPFRRPRLRHRTDPASQTERCVLARRHGRSALASGFRFYRSERSRKVVGAQQLDEWFNGARLGYRDLLALPASRKSAQRLRRLDFLLGESRFGQSDQRADAASLPRVRWNRRAPDAGVVCPGTRHSPVGMVPSLKGQCVCGAGG